MLCPKFNFHVYKLKRWAIGELAWVQRGELGDAQCSKKIDDGPINMTLSKKKGCEHTHEPINMNPTIYIIDNNVGLFFQYIQN
jgi:hypothetical protein